jgi:hypothetical protein
LTVNIEFLWRGLDTGERQAFNQSFQPFRAEPHKFYIYRQYTNIVFTIIIYSEENAFKMRSLKSFSLRLRLRRFSDGINRGINAMQI